MINTWLRALVDLPLAVEILLKVTALLAAGWLLGLCLSHRNPRWRVFLWRGVSLGVLALPFLLLTIPRYEIPFETVAKSAPTASTPPAPAAEAVGEHVDATERTPRPTESLVPELATFFPAVPESSPGLVGWLHDHFFRVLGGIWIVVVLLLSFWALRSSLETRRLVRRSLPAPGSLQAEAKEVASALGCSRTVDVRCSAEVASPVLVGIRRPVILLPSGLVSRGDSDLPAIYAHELAHQKSGDLLWDRVLQALAILFWFHPLVWGMRRSHMTASEEVSDAIAAAYVGDPEHYSRTLARVALDVTRLRQAAAGSPMARTPQIRVRLERLKRSGFHARLGRRVVAASSLVGIVLFIPLAACRFVRADLEQAPTGEEGDRRAAGGPSPRDLFELPHGWKLTHDDGRREDNSRVWPRNMGSDLVQLRVTPRFSKPVTLADTVKRIISNRLNRYGVKEISIATQGEKYDFELRSLDDDVMGKIEVRKGRGRGEESRLIVKPARYRLRFERAWGQHGDNVRMTWGDFLLDLGRPGMYELQFTPSLGSGEITGALNDCFALSFQRSSGGARVRGLVYQDAGKEYLIDGLPAGTYRLSAVKYGASDDTFASVTEVTISGSERVIWNVPGPVSGTCSLRGEILGQLSKPPRGFPGDPKWYVLIRKPGSSNVEVANVYMTRTIDTLYAVRREAIKQVSPGRTRYEIKGLAPGDYTVTVIENPDFSGLPVVSQQSKALALRRDEDAVLDFDFRGVKKRADEVYGRWQRERARKGGGAKKAPRASTVTEAVSEMRLARCSGTVVDPSAKPQSGTPILAYEQAFNAAGGLELRFLGETKTDAAGKFFLEARVTRKRGVVVAKKDGYAVGFVSWTLYGHDRMTIELSPPVKVGGVVVDEKGRAIPDAEVRASLFGPPSADNELVWVPGIEPMKWLAAKTDAAGRFEIDGLRSGAEVGLLVRAPGRSSLYLYGPKAEPKFAPGHRNVRVVLPAEATIAGRVVDKKTNAGIPGFTVAVVPRFTPYFFDRFVAVTGADGSFEVGGLRSGTYLLRGEGARTDVEVEAGRISSNVLLEKE